MRLLVAKKFTIHTPFIFMTLKVLQLTLSENILHPENCGGVVAFFFFYSPASRRLHVMHGYYSTTVLYAVQKDGLYRA